MKYITLDKIIKKRAFELVEGAGYNGAHNDGGNANLLAKLEKFKQKLIVEYDLRPSEYNQLDNKEVGEPVEFLSIIDNYKLKLAKEMVKNIKL